MQHHSYQKRHRRPSVFHILIGMTVLGVLLGLFLRPMLIRSKQNHTAAAASALIAQTVADKLEKVEGSMFTVERDADRIHAVTLQTDRLTKLQLEVDTALRENLEQGWTYSYEEPLGAVLGSELFMTMGPQVKRELILLGTAKTALGSDLTSVGINQTRYRILLSVRCDLQTGFYPDACHITVTGDYTVGEMMIFGELPQMISAIESVSP